MPRIIRAQVDGAITMDIIHPHQTKLEDLIYRFNSFTSRWECWAYEGFWFRSAFGGTSIEEPPYGADKLVSFEDTWCEPNEETDA